MTQKNQTGWVSLHRKLLDNPIGNNTKYLSVWVYILLKANHVNKTIIINHKPIVINRGSFLGSLLGISSHFGISVSQVKKIIDCLEGLGMVKTKRTTKYTIFQVLNYDEYQNRENNEKTTRKQRETTNNDNNRYLIDNIIGEKISEKVWADFVSHRKKKKADISETALTRIKNEAIKAGWGIEDALSEIVMRNWIGFKAEWVKSKRSDDESNRGNKHERLERAADKAIEEILSEQGGHSKLTLPDNAEL